MRTMLGYRKQSRIACDDATRRLSSGYTSGRKINRCVGIMTLRPSRGEGGGMGAGSNRNLTASPANSGRRTVKLRSHVIIARTTYRKLMEITVRRSGVRVTFCGAAQ